MTHSELTFIILARKDPGYTASDTPNNEDIDQLTMIGDVNLFLKGTPPHLRQPGSRMAHLNKDEEEEDFEAELEIMIAGSWDPHPSYIIG